MQAVLTCLRIRCRRRTYEPPANFQGLRQADVRSADATQVGAVNARRGLLARVTEALASLMARLDGVLVER
jgi:hypothetical protein